jgi:predicted nucleotidyltransferase
MGHALAWAVRAALDRFRAALERRFGSRLRELVLFGSHARGDAHEESDVDVLVVVEGLTPEEKIEVFDLGYDADAADRAAWVGLAPFAVSLEAARHLRGRERRIMADIARDGIRLDQDRARDGAA